MIQTFINVNKRNVIPMVNIAAIMLSWTVLHRTCMTSCSTWPFNGSLISGVGPTACSFFLPPSSIAKTSFTHMKDELSGLVNSPSPFSWRSFPNIQMSLCGCLPIQTAALYVSFKFAILHFLKVNNQRMRVAMDWGLGQTDSVYWVSQLMTSLEIVGYACYLETKISHIWRKKSWQVY